MRVRGSTTRKHEATFPSFEKCSSRSLSVTLVDRPVTYRVFPGFTASLLPRLLELDLPRLRDRDLCLGRDKDLDLDLDLERDLDLDCSLQGESDCEFLLPGESAILNVNRRNLRDEALGVSA